MENKNKKNYVLYTLAVLLVILGACLGIRRIQIQKAYTDVVEEAEYAAQNLDTTHLEALGAEKAALDEEIAALDAELQKEQAQIDQLDGALSQADQEYEAKSQEEQNAYYLAIYESLMEGMSKVDSYINGKE